MWIKIIKTKKLEQMLSMISELKKSLTDIMGKYENLHRLHDGLWQRYKNELQSRDSQIEELHTQVRRLEHQRNEFKKKYETLKNKTV